MQSQEHTIRVYNTQTCWITCTILVYVKLSLPLFTFSSQSSQQRIICLHVLHLLYTSFWTFLTASLLNRTLTPPSLQLAVLLSIFFSSYCFWSIQPFYKPFLSFLLMLFYHITNLKLFSFQSIWYADASALLFHAFSIPSLRTVVNVKQPSN